MALTNMTFGFALTLAAALVPQGPSPAGPAPAPTAAPAPAPTPAEKGPWRPLPSPVPDEHEETTAIRVKRAIPISGEPIDDATILVRAGKIVAIGKIVDIPRGARRLDYSQCIAMPGLVHALSRVAYAPKGAPQGAQTKTRDGIDIEADILKRASAAGVTTIAIAPQGAGFSGFASVIRTRGESVDDVLLREDAYLTSQFEMTSAGKDAFRKTLQQAKDEIEKFEKAQKEAAEAPKPDPSKAASAPASAPASGPAPAGAPAPAGTPPATKPSGPPKLDPKLEPMVRILKKERRLLTLFQSGGFGGGLFGQQISAGPAAEILHFHEATKKFDFDRIYVVGAQTLNVLDAVKESKAVVMLPTEEIAFESFTRNRVNTALELKNAGATIVLLPPANPVGNDFPEAFENWLYKVGQLVKNGLPESDALRSVTLTPAEILGVQDRVGSLQAGRDADILFFSGHPFEATTKLLHVMVGGSWIPEREL